MSNQEEYNKLCKELHEEMAKPNNKCDFNIVKDLNAKIEELEIKMGIKRIENV